MASPCTCGANGGQSKKKPPRRVSNKKNPYSDRGMDKFSALLAELEEKKRVIYSKLDPEEVSMIRFVHSDEGSDDVKPVVLMANKKVVKFVELASEKTEEDVGGKLLVGEGSGDGGKGEVEYEEKEIEEGDEMKKEKVNLAWFYVFGGMLVLVLVLIGRLPLRPTICHCV